MSARELPPQASLEQIRKQAKELRKAYRDGDAAAATRIRANLPRLTEGAMKEVVAAEVSLQEVQHVLAREYGFPRWEELSAAVAEAASDDGFGALAWISDRDAQVLLRETRQIDFVKAVKGAPPGVREKFFGNMSPRVRGFIETEIEFRPDLGREQVDAARERMLSVARALADQGQFTWPPVQGERGPEPGPGKADAPLPSKPDLPENVTVEARLLPALSGDEIVQIVEGLADLARRGGILALQPVEERLGDPFLREAIRLLVDGTEPEVIDDIMRTRADTILQNRGRRGRLFVTAIRSITAGDNPGIVREKAEAFFRDEPSQEPARLGDVSLAALQAHLKEAPLSAMDLPAATEFIYHAAYLARFEGNEALAVLVDSIDEELFGNGIRMAVAECADPYTVGKRMDVELEESLRELGSRYSMVLAGALAIQAGRKVPEVVAAMREVA
jgi:hypothetical protein